MISLLLLMVNEEASQQTLLFVLKFYVDVYV